MTDETTPKPSSEEFSPKETDDQPLKEKIEFLEKALAETKEQLLRLHATMDNNDKRHQRDLRDQEKRVKSRVIRDVVLPIADILDQAVTHVTENPEGLEMLFKSFHASLQAQGIIAIEPLHKPFDPNHHEAMSMQKTQDHPHHTVIQVVQKGYEYEGELIRPARVIVAENK